MHTTRPGLSRRAKWSIAGGLAVASILVALPFVFAQDGVQDGLTTEGCAVTPGGWGAPPSGNNPGALLHAHFDDVFGDALVVDGLVFEDAQEVTDTLPVSGDPLLNHAVALAINLAFGDAGLLDDTLSGATVPRGPLAGTTAEDLLAQAETALEDPTRTTSKYSALIDALAMLNQEVSGVECQPVTPPPTTTTPPPTTTTPPVTTTPTPPGGVPCPPLLDVQAHGNRSIELTWGAVADADAYRVYRGTSADDLTLHATTTETTFLDEGLTVGQTYFYMVTAVVDGQESESCEIVQATAIPFFPTFVAGGLAMVAAVGVFAALSRRRHG